jgi:hypothetical protein
MATTPAPFDENYQSVAERIKIFREKYPEGSLCPLNAEKPFEIVTVNNGAFVAVAAVAMRNHNDMAPGMGLAWCPIPGRDQYTRDSEIQNAQTSAWGRAIIAVLAADASKIASAEEVRSAESHRSAPAPAPAPPAAPEAASAPVVHAASATNGGSVQPETAPSATDPTMEAYNAAVIEETLRLMNDSTISYQELRDVWQVLTQARLSARRIAPPAGMEPDGDGMVPIGSAVAFVGKQRKEAAEAAGTAVAEEPPTLDEAAAAPAPRRGRKAAVSE